MAYQLDLNTEDLRIFLNLVRERNFTKVARLHRLTQPAISSRLRQLEESLGVRLFSRKPRQVEPTAEGEMLIPYAEAVLEKAATLRNAIAEMKGKIEGEVRIATTYSLGMYALNEAIRQIISRYPDINLQVQYKRSDVIYELLRKGKIELGLIAFPVASDDIAVQPCGKDRLALVVSSHHRLAGKKNIAIKEITGEPFVSFDTSLATGRIIMDYLQQNDVTVSPRLLDANVDVLKRAVEAGLGIAFLPLGSVREEISKGSLIAIPVKNFSLERPLGLIYSTKRPVSRSWQLVMQQFAELGLLRS